VTHFYHSTTVGNRDGRAAQPGRAAGLGALRLRRAWRRSLPGQPEGLHDRTCLLGAQILDRAQQHGAVRPDITVADLLCLVWANSRIIEATGEIAPRAWRRHLHLMLDAFRAGHTHPLPEPALTDDQLYQAMAHLSQ
jgi:hypothetical protein